MESGLRAGLANPRDTRNIGAARPAPSCGKPQTKPPIDGAGAASKESEIPFDLVTEDAAAQQFVGLHGNRLRYCWDTGAWFEWDGAIWRENRTGLAFQFARELARDLAASESPKVRYVTSRTSFASGVERFARSDPALAITIEHWDRDPLLLGTPAGTVDLRTGELRPSVPTEGVTKSTAVAPAATADCSRWLRFLEETTGGDTKLVRFLQQWCGYCLTGVTREHALVFVYGPGGNGKSVFLNVVTGIMGAYATTAAMDTFTAAKGDRHPTDLAMLRGARLVTASETEDGRAWAESRIKQMTGGDPISARFMRMDFFTYVPTFKLTVVGNHKPLLRNVDEAARRRFNIVPFTRKPPTPDPRLEEKLRTEWSSILRWMLGGALDWQANGLVRPQTVLAATEDYFSAQDLFGQWLEEECELDPGNTYKVETSTDLFASWRAYAERAAEPAGSQKSFAENMQRRGVEPKRTNRLRGFTGIRLKTPQPSRGDG
jgi:putative DNA primase/helicase